MVGTETWDQISLSSGLGGFMVSGSTTDYIALPTGLICQRKKDIRILPYEQKNEYRTISCINHVQSNKMDEKNI